FGGGKGGKGGSHSARREFIDGAAGAIRHKQIARAVKGQSIRSSIAEKSSFLHSAPRSDFNDAVADCPYKQIARAIKSHSFRKGEPEGLRGGKSALHSVRRVFIDVGAAVVVDI